MKIRLATLCVLVCSLVVTAQAQTKLVAFGEIGTAKSFGYSLPDLNFGAVLEQPITKYAEWQLSASWSPSNKIATRDGNSVMVKTSGIAWLHKNIGFNAGVRYGHTWTGVFHKGGAIAYGGPVLRFYDDEVRLYAVHIRQIFEGIDKAGIETSNIRGAEIMPEIKFGRFRVGYRWVIARGLSQGNPQCDGTFTKEITCPRDPWLALSSGVRLGFEF